VIGVEDWDPNSRNVRHPRRGLALIFIYSVDLAPYKAERLPR